MLLSLSLFCEENEKKEKYYKKETQIVLYKLRYCLEQNTPGWVFLQLRHFYVKNTIKNP
jgi:hypothetical protein